jgi:hypothetical protein
MQADSGIARQQSHGAGVQVPLCYDNEGKQLYDQEKNRKELSRWIDQTGGSCLAFDFGTKGILQVRNAAVPF